MTISKAKEQEMAKAIGLEDISADGSHRCHTCGKRHQSTETLQLRNCEHERTMNHYCDEVCFKWRYFDPKHMPKRYDQPKYFGAVS